MDDKTGKVCKEGAFPVLNTLKRELIKDEAISSTKQIKQTSCYPRGFWSNEPNTKSNSIQIIQFSIYLIDFLLFFIFWFPKLFI